MKYILFWRRGIGLIALFLRLLLIFGGCDGGNNNSPTTPQNGSIDMSGTWDLTYTLTSNTCDFGDSPGTTYTETITFSQSGTQISSPDFSSLTGTINTTTGEFTITQSVLFLSVTMSGVTDGSTMNGTYIGTGSRIDNGAPCAIEYDVTGSKTS
jgi:hypothetical protein